MKRAHTIIAEHFGMDAIDVYEGRYHYGHTRIPIYVIGDDYYAVSRERPKDELRTFTAIATLRDGRSIWEAKR